MWEAIKEILTSSNAVGVLLILGFLLLVIIVIAVVLIKGNVFQIHTQVVSIGYAAKERNIILTQLDYVEKHLEDAEANIPKDDDYDSDLGEKIVMKVYIEYSKWIACNHMTKTGDYIQLKQDILVSIVNKMTKNQRYKGEEFKQYIRDDTQNTIYELIRIRETFK